MDTPNATAPPAEAVHTDAAHAQRTEENPPVTETPAPKPAAAPRQGIGQRLKNAWRERKKPTLTPRRLFFFLDENDQLDVTRTQPENLERIAAAVRSTHVRQALGLVDATGAAAPSTWASTTGALIDAINLLAVQAAVNTWKLTDDQARLLVLRQDTKKQADGRTVHETVTQLTGELLDKYFPGGFSNYDKEISLLLVLGVWTVAQVQEVKKLAPAKSADVVTFPQSAPAAAH